MGKKYSAQYWEETLGLIKENISDENGIIETPSVMKEGSSPFIILISTIISLRTKDKVTEEASEHLFNVASKSKEMISLSAERIGELIYPCGFFRRKGEQILKIAKILMEDYEGEVPSEKKALMALPGVGLKTANLVLSLGFAIPAICVDIHVHRICNRLGWIETATPEKSEGALSILLPEKYHIPINHLMVKFGQNTCTPQSPHCSRCPLSGLCPAIGVEKKR